MKRITTAALAAASLLLAGTAAAMPFTPIIAQHPRRHAHPLRHPTRGASYQHATASWYNDAGQTASGWHARYGFATCGSGGGPCYSFGTRVQFCLGRRCIVAVADDHGPYVAGRWFDLGASTAHAIGFSGVETVAFRVLSR